LEAAPDILRVDRVVREKKDRNEDSGRLRPERMNSHL
jgi:hypothetical protein